jgi:hypothetical protein
MSGSQDPLGILSRKDPEDRIAAMRLSLQSLIRRTGYISVGIFLYPQNSP